MKLPSFLLALTMLAACGKDDAPSSATAAAAAPAADATPAAPSATIDPQVRALVEQLATCAPETYEDTTACPARDKVDQGLDALHDAGPDGDVIEQQIIDALVRLLVSPDEKTRLAASALLSMHEPDGAVAIAALLAERSPRVQLALARVIAGLDIQDAYLSRRLLTFAKEHVAEPVSDVLVAPLLRAQAQCTPCVAFVGQKARGATDPAVRREVWDAMLAVKGDVSVQLCKEVAHHIDFDSADHTPSSDPARPLHALATWGKVCAPAIEHVINRLQSAVARQSDDATPGNTCLPSSVMAPLRELHQVEGLAVAQQQRLVAVVRQFLSTTKQGASCSDAIGALVTIDPDLAAFQRGFPAGSICADKVAALRVP